MEIAYGRFAKEDGLVVDIRKDVSSTSLFNCQFWSDFTEENERFFLGSLQGFVFKSIHSVSTKQNFEPFVRVIDILRWMIDGYPYHFGAVSSSDVLCLSRLMNGDKDHDISHFMMKLSLNIQNTFSLPDGYLSRFQDLFVYQTPTFIKSLF